MVALDAVETTSTIGSPVESVPWTSPRTQSAKPDGKPGSPPGFRSGFPWQTGPVVDPAEWGSEDERNQAASPAANGVGEPKKGDEPGGEGARVRSERARELVRRVKELEPLVGEVSLAAHIGLLKRDLSRCHGALAGHAGESNYLSIITLVESAMAQMKWKEYTRGRLEAIRRALDIGYREARVRFEHYEKAQDLLSQGDVDATPRLDLGSVAWDDIEDGED